MPAIGSLGCDLLHCLATRFVAIYIYAHVSNISVHGRLGPILDPHLSRLVSILNFQLEQNPTSLVFSCYAFTSVF